MDKQSLHEINRYADAAFPVGMYTVTKSEIIPEGRGYMDLHWHEELQFTLVVKGTVEMQVDGRQYTLKEDQAIFINRNLLHVTNGLSDEGRYISINFPDKLLGFFAGSRMESDYVLPYTMNYCFPAIVFRAEVPWQKRILEELWQLRELLFKREHMYEYKVSQKLVTIWMTLVANAEGCAGKPSKGYVRKQERMRKMLSYIHENYMHHICLSDVAGEAGVSVGECCRCFRELVRESPNQYLLNYRILQAMEMLSRTELSITEIALRCGFNDTSHFIQYFKRKTDMTPGEFRGRKC